MTLIASPQSAQEIHLRLTLRFLGLPALDRYRIARSLGLAREGDDALPPDAAFLQVFRRASEEGRLADLWDETERCHDGPAAFNPFRESRREEETP